MIIYLILREWKVFKSNKLQLLPRKSKLLKQIIIISYRFLKVPRYNFYLKK